MELFAEMCRLKDNRRKIFPTKYLSVGANNSIGQKQIKAK